MKLLIVSHTPHYRKDNQVVGWGATLREIDQLATLFDEVIHLAPLHSASAPDSALPYEAHNVRFVPVPASGGQGIRSKLGILFNSPIYIREILRQMRKVDIVHVRCPANISLMAVLAMTLRKHPPKRWTKYAGNWKPAGREPLSYTLQRWWLIRGWQGGVVTVNGEWDDLPPHIHSFLNPCLTDAEVEEGRACVAQKSLSSPIRLIYVGRLETPKGVGRILRIVSELAANGLAVTADLIGDGSERPSFENMAAALGIQDKVTFHGWLPRAMLNPLYARSHVMLFPSSSSEGWPKVLSEAMAYGVVPVTSSISSIPQYLQKFKVGKSFEPDDLQGFVKAVLWYAEHQEGWKTESARAAQAAEQFSYTNYLNAVRQLLGLA